MSREMASRLRHRLTLQQEVRTSDGAGGYARIWQDVANLWAEIVPLVSTGSARGAGKEALTAGQLQSQVTHRIRLRYRDGMTAGMRLIFEGRAFNIRSISDMAENRETLDLLVEEGVAA